jgi:hypothetical protein
MASQCQSWEEEEENPPQNLWREGGFAKHVDCGLLVPVTDRTNLLFKPFLLYSWSGGTRTLSIAVLSPSGTIPSGV